MLENIVPLWKKAFAAFTKSPLHRSDLTDHMRMELAAHD